MLNFSSSEKQLITTLAWFRTRYAYYLDLDPKRSATKESLNSFGSIWIGKYKEDWDSAFASLIEKGIFQENDGDFSFTEKGEIQKEKVESETPFFKYEYDQFFDASSKSRAHADFCNMAYGQNLNQHGMIDVYELDSLVDLLKEQNPKSVLDLGCGNGQITEYLYQKVHANYMGLDISNRGIEVANTRFSENPKLQFTVGNLNDLSLENQYDALLFLDTLYYVDSPEKVLKDCLEITRPDGAIYIYFSAWTLSEEEKHNLNPQHTSLAKTLNNLNLSFEFKDLTSSGVLHWKRKLKVLEEMKEAFAEEGNEELWWYRFREANRYANWPDSLYARYLYKIKAS